MGLIKDIINKRKLKKLPLIARVRLETPEERIAKIKLQDVCILARCDYTKIKNARLGKDDCSKDKTV